MKSHVHFMGIGGISMSALARWYHAEGYQVSGCDIKASPMLEQLEQEGITTFVGHHPEHLKQVDMLIHNMAIAQDEAELVQARSQGMRLMKRIELLGDLLAKRRGIAVTGTHGKSTTTGMISTIFLDQDDPSLQLGCILDRIEGNMRYGQGDYLIAEVDESDPGFAALSSEIAVVTNLEADHIAGEFDEARNYHKSFATLKEAMAAFASKAESLIYSADWPVLAGLFAKHPKALSYGEAAHADYRLVDIQLDAFASRATLCFPDGQVHDLVLIVPGKHNLENATAALAVAHQAGLDVPEALTSIGFFKGVGRRWQRRGSVAGALVIDDYAHHPTEIEVTLTTAQHTGRRVRAVVQPHRHVRTAQLWEDIADAAALADEIIVTDIYASGEAAIEGINATLIVKRLQAQGKMVSHHSLDSASAYLAASLQANDLVITLGAGDVWKVAETLVSLCGGDDGSA